MPRRRVHPLCPVGLGLSIQVGIPAPGHGAQCSLGLLSVRLIGAAGCAVRPSRRQSGDTRRQPAIRHRLSVCLFGSHPLEGTFQLGQGHELAGAGPLSKRRSQHFKALALFQLGQAFVQPDRAMRNRAIHEGMSQLMPQHGFQPGRNAGNIAERNPQPAIVERTHPGGGLQSRRRTVGRCRKPRL